MEDLQMNHKIYSTDHSLVEIEKVSSFGDIGTKTETWSWEITIANNQKEYKGKAIESRGRGEINWVNLTSSQPFTEMINHCKRCME
jgi:hypothetical protein